MNYYHYFVYLLCFALVYFFKNISCYLLRHLASSSFDGTAAVWERRSDGEFECISVLEGHENEVKSVAWSPSGTSLFPLNVKFFHHIHGRPAARHMLARQICVDMGSRRRRPRLRVHFCSEQPHSGFWVCQYSFLNISSSWFYSHVRLTCSSCSFAPTGRQICDLASERWCNFYFEFNYLFSYTQTFAEFGAIRHPFLLMLSYMLLSPLLFCF